MNKHILTEEEIKLESKLKNIKYVVNRKLRMNRNKMLRKTLGFITSPFRK
jgi:hypothetical protein